MEHHPANLILTATYGLLLLSFSSHLPVFLQKRPLWRTEKFKWSLKHSNTWLNVMTFISQATCVDLLQRWRVKISISFTYKWQKKRRLPSSNNYFCASAVFMTFTFTPTSIMALYGPRCGGMLMECACVCVCVCGHVYVVYEDTNLYNDMGMT